MKKRSFFFHFNKPATQRAGTVKISFHYKGVCHIVDNIDVRVPTVGRIRSSQPKFVMTGRCEYAEINDGVATVYY